MSGLSVIRGMPVPVVSLALLLGKGGEASVTRLVVMKVQERRVALAVESVIGVRAIGGSAIAGLPPLLANAQVDFVAALGALDARLLVVLESGRIVPDALWSTLRVRSDEA
jgi:purine-binding chemotaxis protein CheW